MLAGGVDGDAAGRGGARTLELHGRRAATLQLQLRRQQPAARSRWQRGARAAAVHQRHLRAATSAHISRRPFVDSSAYRCCILLSAFAAGAV